VDYAKLIVIFTSIIYEALPFVVLGVVLAGLLEEFVPQQLIARLIPKSNVLTVAAICVGGLLGLAFPMCECGIIPVMRRLLRKGIPLSVCVCYMLAGPIINVVVIASTMAAFSGQQIPLSENRELPLSIVFAACRVGFGYLVAVATSIIVEWQWRAHGTDLLAPMVVKDTLLGKRADPGKDEGGATRHTWGQSINHITETALHDFIDIMAFLVLGAAIAALFRILLPLFDVEKYIEASPILAILLMMAFAVAFCLCSEADAFVAANFQPIGLWPLASKLAFLVLGPMLDFKLYLMYTRVFRQRLIFTIITAVVIQVFLYSVLVHYVSEAWLQQNRQVETSTATSKP
jgi:uncharacterized membrane protein YraQ (UPF0718 family)